MPKKHSFCTVTVSLETPQSKKIILGVLAQKRWEYSQKVVFRLECDPEMSSG